MTGKAKIVAIGTFDDLGMPTGWHFDLRGADCPAIMLGDSIRVGGYTLDELRALTESSEAK